jgi:hypothetical protein
LFFFFGCRFALRARVAIKHLRVGHEINKSSSHTAAFYHHALGRSLPTLADNNCAAALFHILMANFS